MRLKATFLFSILFLFAAVHTVSATSVLPIQDSALADQAAVIAEGTVTGAGPAAAFSSGTGRPATEYRLRVERALKGDVQGGSLVLRVPGGRAANGLVLKIWGAPELRIGERALVFLVPNGDGTYGPLHLALGTFHELRSEGRRLAVRDLSEVYEVHEAGAAGNSSGGVRDLERFGSWLADRAAGVQREADYFVPAPRMGVAWEAFTYLQGIKQRWLEFDRGEDVPWRAHAAGQVGFPGGGFAEFQAALQAWNDDPATNIRYRYDGTTTVANGFKNFDQNNVILFHDAHGEAPGSFSCPTPGRGSGVLAIGGTWINVSTTPATIEAGDIVINDNAICWFTNSERMKQIYGHELGHTLGLGHSCGDDVSGPCDPKQNKDKADALMRATAHNDNRGAVLQKDDKAGVLSLYPDPNGGGGGDPNKPAAPSNLEAEGLSRSVRLTWNDNSDDETLFVVEMKKGKKYKAVGSVKKDVTSAMVVGLAAGKSYTFRVTAKKGKVASDPSETVTVRTN
ncbi:MAG TPA: fibronectin type III domain-containing protein [Thermoanaerobaculia bacterium]|nr:fibronectin type III domain-containing protein [Thermoanaerobaculia bacterium]